MDMGWHVLSRKRNNVIDLHAIYAPAGKKVVDKD
jgi:hypothetical protein